MTTGRINQVTVLNAPGPKAGARTEYSRRTVCAPLLGQSSLPSTGLRSAVPAAAHPTRPPARGWPSALSWRSTGRLLDPRSHKLRRSSAGPRDQRHPPRWRLPTNGRERSRCCRDAADLQVVSSRELAIGNQSTPFASARNNRKRALRDCDSGSRELHAPPSSPGSTASRSGASCRAGPSTDRYRDCRPETPVGGRSQRRSPGGLDALLNHQPTVPCLEA